MSYNVDIAKLIQPEIVNSIRRVHEVARSELTIRLRSGGVELVENPSFDEALVTGGLSERVITIMMGVDRNAYLRSRMRHEFLIEFEHSKLGSIEDLIAKLSVAMYT